MAIDTRQARTCLGGVGHTHTHTHTDLGIEGEHTCHLGDRFTNTGHMNTCTHTHCRDYTRSRFSSKRDII